MVLNHALCYLLSRWKKDESEKLKIALSDFYSTEEITCAKDILIETVGTSPVIKMPEMMKQQRGFVYQWKEIEYLIQLSDAVEEAGLLQQLPIFVSDNPLKMPSIHFLEGVLRGVMNRFDKFETKFAMLESVVNKSLALSAIKPVKGKVFEAGQLYGPIADVDRRWQ
jgi:hypothetical protein